MRATMAMASQRRPAPFLPFEGPIYAAVLAAYLVYAGARAVQLIQEGRAPHVLHVAAANPYLGERLVRREISGAVGTTDGVEYGILGPRWFCPDPYHWTKSTALREWCNRAVSINFSSARRARLFSQIHFRFVECVSATRVAATTTIR